MFVYNKVHFIRFLYTFFFENTPVTRVKHRAHLLKDVDLAILLCGNSFPHPESAVQVGVLKIGAMDWA